MFKEKKSLYYLVIHPVSLVSKMQYSVSMNAAAGRFNSNRSAFKLN